MYNKLHYQCPPTWRCDKIKCNTKAVFIDLEAGIEKLLYLTNIKAKLKTEIFKFIKTQLFKEIFANIMCVWVWSVWVLPLKVALHMLYVHYWTDACAYIAKPFGFPERLGHQG